MTDEVELLKGVSDIWDDSAEIIESLHELRTRIEALCADAKGKDKLADIYDLVYSQVDLVLASLQVTLDRIQSSVDGTVSMGSTALSERSDGAGDGAERDSVLKKTVASEHAPRGVAAPEHGSSAKLTANRRVSSLLSRLAADRWPGSSS